MATHDSLSILFGLIVTALVSGMGVVVLLRIGPPQAKPTLDVVRGFPPERFPDRQLVQIAPLSALVATQARLISMYAQLPHESELAVWVRAFLLELRQIMDSAYRVASVAVLYDQTTQLDSVVSEVQRIEAQLAETAMQRMLNAQSDIDTERFETRLAVLRRCVKELARP
ncbi:hypothetical protein HC891_17430 [Candidatus Gracilibacteria bacterium]|nr:hypothetical protein [Candidatus Gracilibacteria bacterium]